MVDVTDATFQTEVIDRSQQVPVVVDLWAPWCGPCKTLGPILEKVIGETNGAVVLAKVNVDENPGASQAFQVQSIPAVYAMAGGQVVDGFVGAKGEADVREFVSRLAAANPAANPAATAEDPIEALLEAGDEASLQQILVAQPDHEGAIIALAAIFVDQGNPQEAINLLARIPESDATKNVAARARLALTAQDSGLAGEAEIEARLMTLLPTVKVDDEARAEFVDLLEVLGATHPNTALWRKKLSTALF